MASAMRAAPADEGLSAWLRHGSRAGERAARVAAGVRAARAQAEDELARGGQSVELMAARTLRAADSTLALRRMQVARTDAALRRAVRSRRAAACDRIAKAERAAQLARERARVRALQEAARRAAAAKAAREADERARATEAERRDGEIRAAAERARADAARRAAEEQARIAAAETAAAESAQRAAAASAAAASAPGRIEWPPSAAETRAAYARMNEAADGFRKSKEPDTKRLRLSLKKAINLAGNQVAASERQVAKSVQAMVRALRTAAAAGVPAHAFAVGEVAERLVGEGGTAARGAAVFAVAAVMAGVAAHAPDRSSMVGALRGAFLARCIYVAPASARRGPGDTDADWRARIGSRDGEGAEGYINRMAGFVGLFAALVVTMHARGGPRLERSPFTPDEGWTWLARIVNGKQRSITPAIVVSFLENAGYGLSRMYGKQFAKLMGTVKVSVLEGAVAGTPPGPRANLEAILREFGEMGNRFKDVPEGMVFPESDAVNE